MLETRVNSRCASVEVKFACEYFLFLSKEFFWSNI